MYVNITNLELNKQEKEGYAIMVILIYYANHLLLVLLLCNRCFNFPNTNTLIFV